MATLHYRFTESEPDIEKKVDTLLAQMTLAEKAWQMTQYCPERVSHDDSENYVRQGAGSILNFYDVAEINRLQRIAMEETRLGIPLLVGNDVIHGYRTIFPIPLAWSCTWDPVLVQEAAQIAATEATAHGTNWAFTPMVDVCRDARWGRIAEGAGEDPFLGAAMAAAQVRGFQSPLENGRKLVACAKHYVAYGAAEDGRDYNSVDISERTLRDVYLPPFQAAFAAGVGTVMSAFNEIAGVPCTSNAFVLRQILRQENAYPGMVVSDWNAINELLAHGVAADRRDAARLAVQAGVDMDMSSRAYADYLEGLVAADIVPLAYVDEAVRRILRLKLLLGLFENPYVDLTEAAQAILRPDYRAKALELAQKSIVLLKNENNLLPLSADVRRIALIGPLADDHHEILGCWHRIGRDEDTESVLDGLRQVLPDTEIVHVRGCDLEGNTLDVETAVAAATTANVAILVLGEGEAMSGEAHSRASLGLPGQQQALLAAVQATQTPVVVVLMSGRPLAVPWMAANISAILQAWHGGIRSGRAVADILIGTVNPSGKLTASWPMSVGQVPLYYGHKNTGRPADGSGTLQFNVRHWTTFIDEKNGPLYPFGYGLSYTDFTYSELCVKTPQVSLDGDVVVTAVLTNSGSRTGDEIVQLYVRDLVAEVTRPVRELKGFQRVTLAPGERMSVQFVVPVTQLGFHGLDLQYKVEPGRFQVWIGPNAAVGLVGEFEVVSSR